MTHFKTKEWYGFDAWFVHASDKQISQTLIVIASTIATGNNLRQTPRKTLEQVENVLLSVTAKKAT